MAGFKSRTAGGYHTKQIRCGFIHEHFGIGPGRTIGVPNHRHGDIAAGRLRADRIDPQHISCGSAAEPEMNREMQLIVGIVNEQSHYDIGRAGDGGSVRTAAKSTQYGCRLSADKASGALQIRNFSHHAEIELKFSHRSTQPSVARTAAKLGRAGGDCRLSRGGGGN